MAENPFETQIGIRGPRAATGDAFKDIGAVSGITSYNKEGQASSGLKFRELKAEVAIERDNEAKSNAEGFVSAPAGIALAFNDNYKSIISEELEEAVDAGLTLKMNRGRTQIMTEETEREQLYDRYKSNDVTDTDITKLAALSLVESLNYLAEFARLIETEASVVINNRELVDPEYEKTQEIEAKIREEKLHEGEHTLQQIEEEYAARQATAKTAYNVTPDTADKFKQMVKNAGKYYGYVSGIESLTEEMKMPDFAPNQVEEQEGGVVADIVVQNVIEPEEPINFNEDDYKEMEDEIINEETISLNETMDQAYERVYEKLNRLTEGEVAEELNKSYVDSVIKAVKALEEGKRSREKLNGLEKILENHMSYIKAKLVKHQSN